MTGNGSRQFDRDANETGHLIGRQLVDSQPGQHSPGLVTIFWFGPQFGDAHRTNAHGFGSGLMHWPAGAAHEQTGGATCFFCFISCGGTAGPPGTAYCHLPPDFWHSATKSGQLQPGVQTPGNGLAHKQATICFFCLAGGNGNGCGNVPSI